jgi:hypothetical protein
MIIRFTAFPRVVDVASHLITGAVPGIGPSQDSPDFTPAMRQAAALVRFDTALADAGYDAEHNHRLCREELGLRRSVIALTPRNAGERPPKTPYRRALHQSFPAALSPALARRERLQPAQAPFRLRPDRPSCGRATTRTGPARPYPQPGPARRSRMRNSTEQRAP